MSYNTKSAATLTGLTLRQVDEWDRARVVKPSLKERAGRGSGRFYSFADLVLLKVAETLKDAGISQQKTKAVIQYLKKHWPERGAPLTGLQFITDGDAIFVLSKDSRVILKALAQGRMLFVLALGRFIEDLQCAMDDACKERAYKVSVNRKAYEVVLYPDTEEGGYCVACPALLGCDSQGDTVDAALDMIKDAIKGHLAVSAKMKKKRTAA